MCRIFVNDDLSVPGHDNIFALGDTASCPGSDGKPLPGLAAVAKQQGEYVAKVLRARIDSRAHPGPFRYRDLGSMATIGRGAAVADLRLVRLGGTVAWWLCLTSPCLVDARNRTSVLMDWSYLTFNRRIRLITGPER